MFHKRVSERCAGILRSASAPNLLSTPDDVFLRYIPVNESNDMYCVPNVACPSPKISFEPSAPFIRPRNATVLSRFCLVFGDVTLMRHRASLCVFACWRKGVPAFYSIHLCSTHRMSRSLVRVPFPLLIVMRHSTDQLRLPW